jgi:AcrR family transcriptional regulator
MQNELPIWDKIKKKALATSISRTAATTRGLTSRQKGTAVEVKPAVNKTRQRILDVATQQFAAKGYDGARVDDIMRLSKVSKNLIYHYFGSKEKLFIAVLEQAYQGMHEHQTTWPLDLKSPVDGIRKLVQSTSAIGAVLLNSSVS